jgi:hypothetical protein
MDEQVKFSAVMFKVNTPGFSGRVYSKELLEKVADRINSDSLFITSSPSDWDLSRMVGVVKSAKVDESDLVVDGTIAKHMADVVQHGQFFMTPMGQGEVNDGVVDPDSYSIKAAVLSPTNGWEGQTTCEIEEFAITEDVSLKEDEAEDTE